MTAQTIRRTRRVWAALTRQPNTTYRELAQRTRLPHTTVRDAVGRLVAAGYVETNARAARGRRVLVGLWEVGR